MQQWEYKIIIPAIHLSAILRIARWELDVDGVMHGTEKAVVEYMNKLGAEGWELASSITGTDHNGNVTKTILIFKRPKASAA